MEAASLHEEKRDRLASDVHGVICDTRRKEIEEDCRGGYLAPKDDYIKNINTSERETFTSVFLNLFTAAEPSANVYVAHGNLCNDARIFIATTA